VPEHKTEVASVPLNLLIIDPRVQRPIDKRKADKMAADLNLDAIGLICVSRREVYHGLTLAEEAAMFRLRNNRTSVQKIDLFKVRVTEGDATAVAISDMLHRLGWTVGTDSTDGYFAAIGALETVWNLDPTGQPPAAERAIAAITTAWGHDRSGVHQFIVGGLGSVFARYGAEIDSGGLIDRLAKFPGGAANLVGKARGLRELRGGTGPAAVAELVVMEYNRHRKTRALRPWRAE
jgi:hypothetical protein